MPTFLTSKRMHPALAARVRSSVRRGRSSSGGTRTIVVAGRRVVLVTLIASALAFLLVARSRADDELTFAKRALAASHRAEHARFPGEDVQTVNRVERWLKRLAGPYDGDVVDTALRGDGALSRMLSRPMVYVRGSVKELGTEEAMTAAASASVKDAFLLCLRDPPEIREEKALLAKVSVAYAGGAPLEERTANVARLHAAELAKVLFHPAWARQIDRAETLREVERLGKQLSTAPLDEARRAAASRLLLAVMDEPGISTGLSEMDGERPHDVRVALVDLSAEAVLLRLRKHVDPAWISPARRPSYASGLDSCALAMDVLESTRR